MNVTEIECGRYHNDSDFTSKCRYYFDGVLVPIIATFGVLGGYIQLEEGSGLKRPFGYYAYFATCK